MCFFEVSTKCLKAFAHPSARKTPFTLDEAISLSEQHLPSPESIPLCGCKCTTLGTRMLLFQTSVFLTSSKQGNTQTGWQGRETDHKNSLNEDKEIHSLSSEKCT
jgi:hypothetical protein